MTQANSPMQTIIGEFSNISPEIVNCFVFDKEGEILACDEATSDEKSKNFILAFKGLDDHAQVIGGIKSITIQGIDNQLNTTEMHNRFLTTVSTRSADEKTVKSLTNVIMPTVMALVYPTDSKDVNKVIVEPIAPEPEPIQETSSLMEVSEDKDPVPEVSNYNEPEPSVPKPYASQFMVEKIGGLLVAADTVRVDNEVIAKWGDLYGNNQIEEIQIENLEGKTITCKFKPIKEVNVKGIIQMPEKILQTLQTGKGKLVVVKPIIMQNREKKA